ncbi:hypothetical protein IU486_18465 [Streptomyces gardneri]|uniref:hypothetical protein n=1 Tax=Nocardia sputi TaxID=2943705 RepID=UPI001895070A|nr:hypothetical protein [Nocardia sputi]MBF6166720.1 hypothetical protein [Streptomyces gardneri]
MVERRILHTAGLARHFQLLAVLVLLAGIVAMHSAVFAASGHVHASGAQAAPVAEAMLDEPGRAAGAPTGPAHHASGGVETSPHHRIAAVPTHEGSPTRHGHLQPQDRTQAGSADSFGSAGTTAAAAGSSRLTRTISGGAATKSWAVAARSVAVAMSPVDDMPCAGGGCDGAHSGLHGCVFILVALLALAALVLLYRIAVDRPGSGAARPRHWRPRRERPPPWTVLTLAELAILRI